MSLQIEMKIPAVPIRSSITPDFLICLTMENDSNLYDVTWVGSA